ncbi:MAG: sigma-70 family RNA polymerase sigma factor [Spirochaetia bacterium]|nr:sigma-70 family RNA polymerase sigma factor [Spirochaetia bacterium]
MDDKELQLINKAKTGDRRAFEELARSCGQRIYRLARRLSGNEQAAEDIAQEALLNAYKSMTRFKADSSFYTWVSRIAVNIWKNRVRYEKRRFFFFHDSLDEVRDTQEGGVKPEIADKKEDTAAELEKIDKKEKVQAALSKLPELSRAIIILRDIEELSYEEVAVTLAIPLGTVKSRVARARESLKNELLKLMGDEDGE